MSIQPVQSKTVDRMSVHVFESNEQLGQRAITLTVPGLLAAKHVFAVVPELRKAPAVNAALRGPLTPDLPASILRTKPYVTMYLDRQSASLLDLRNITS